MAAADGTQTPIWVPVLVGAIGLVGVLATQIVASARAGRERRAAERREDTRWEREREQRQLLFDREDRYRSHSERSDAYAALGLALEHWHDRLRTATAGWRAVNRRPGEDEEALLREAGQQTEEAAALVMLLAPKAIRDVYRATWMSFSYTQLLVTSDQSTQEEVASSIGKATKRYWRLLDELRLDLGVEPDDATDPEPEPTEANESDPTKPPALKRMPPYRGPH
jgi:hypothetical protein